MKTREQREQLKQAQCRHYHGCQGDTCGAGVNLLNWNAGSRLAFIPTLPCYGGLNPMDNEPNGSACEKYNPHTPEELAAEEAEFQERFGFMMTARQSIIATIEASGIRHGVMTCPECDGNLHYSQASNGHVHAQCQTTGCLSWME